MHYADWFHGRRGHKPRNLQTNWWARACAAVVLCLTAAVAVPAQTLKVLASFGGTNGDSPHAPPVQAADGYLYGTTYGGGTAGFGTVFRIAQNGPLVTLYSFCSQSGCPDGAFPAAGLLAGGNGDLFGTTLQGGLNDYGTVFKITPSGAQTTMHSFDNTDGAYPSGALVQTNDGSLYGTTQFGGSHNSGTVFKLAPTGTLTTLHSFCSEPNCADGRYPSSALLGATDGSFYGTTLSGGSTGAGTVFKVTLDGILTTLYTFCSQDGCVDGGHPVSALVQGDDGNFYGTTLDYGDNSVCDFGCGTVFRITSNGSLVTLQSFDGNDGGNPAATLVRATDGNFYGTTEVGGANNGGTVFAITPTGSLTTVYDFCGQANCQDGNFPFVGVTQDTNGRLYGTTVDGGAYGYGAAFALSVGLRPFVKTEPSSGIAGSAVRVLGTNLSGATSVTFNGTAATFTVVSPSLITTTVPSGATTGKVKVTTPHGTLTSNVPFRVPAAAVKAPTRNGHGPWQ